MHAESAQHQPPHALQTRQYSDPGACGCTAHPAQRGHASRARLMKSLIPEESAREERPAWHCSEKRRGLAADNAAVRQADPRRSVEVPQAAEHVAEHALGRLDSACGRGMLTG